MVIGRLTVEFAAHHRNLKRRKVALHEVLAVVAGVSSSSIVEEDLSLQAIPGEHRLLDVDEEAHEVLLVGGFGQPHHAAILEAGADCSEHCGSHLPVVLRVQHWILLSGPALSLHLHG